MNETLIAALVGALVGGGFAILGGIVVHFLNLREDRIKRERDKADKRAEEIKRNLLPDVEGTDKAKIVKAYGGQWTWSSDGKLRKEEDRFQYWRDYGELESDLPEDQIKRGDDSDS